ncbi:MAG: hypothetical protein JRJ62_16450, partial [Deltaproteobacteria bacterium]|nr:hypothetical protein [Deltaproteobacteria bacterium]
LPKDIFEITPWLAYWMGACRLSFKPKSSTEYFEQAFERFNDQEDAAGIFLAWAGIVDSIIYTSENFKPLDQWIGIIERIVERFGNFPSEDIEARVASSMFLALTLRQPHHPEVEAWAERALSTGDVPETLNAKVQTLVYLIRHQIYAGNLEKATLALESLKQLQLFRDASHLFRILANLAEASYSYCTGSLEKCKNTVSKGLELSRKTGIHVFDFMLTGQAVLSALDEKNLSDAGNLLEQMDSSLDSRTPWDICFYHLLKAREALIQKNPKKAYYHADLSLKYNSKIGDLNNVGLHQLLMAYVMIELGEYQQAAKYIKDIFYMGSQFKSTFGLEALRKALAYGKNCGYFYSFWDIPSKTGELYSKAIEAGIEVDYVQNIIRKRNLVPDEPPVHLDNWPWAIQIFTLGRFELIIDGTPFKFPKKAQKKPLEMLKVLISFGEGQEVGKPWLCDILWPEADGDFTVFVNSSAMTKPLTSERADYPLTYGIAGWTAWLLNVF